MQIQDIPTNDLVEVYEMVEDILNSLLCYHPLSYMVPTFDDDLYYSTCMLSQSYLQCVYQDISEDIVHAIVKEAYANYFMKHPKRSSRVKESNVLPNVTTMRVKLTYLSNIPQPEQRTDEWYLFRHKYLTASSIWKAFGSDSTRNQLIYSKCAPMDVKRYSNVNIDSPMHWGHKYEYVTLQWYQHIYNTIVSDFGCIPHSTYSYIAASPDGINTDETSTRYGRMIEVKNIVNRVITGIPKQEYWIQMQIQMEVCDLDNCDFVETRFKEYENIEEFEQDGTYTQTSDGKSKGVCMLFIDDTQPIYEYSPWASDKECIQTWVHDNMNRHKDKTWLKNIYWKLDEVSVVFVERNKLWFEHALPILQEVWNIIEVERVSGYEHRSPKKRVKKIEPETPLKCNILL
uniref:YqaJ viral recombinase domain-containing protein n=1 Tax=viral metagenome TaxID=1070528 RepID=A0A6C0JWM8_9ZZZZ